MGVIAWFKISLDHVYRRVCKKMEEFKKSFDPKSKLQEFTILELASDLNQIENACCERKGSVHRSCSCSLTNLESFWERRL